MEISSSVPFSLSEFQGGNPDFWFVCRSLISFTRSLNENRGGTGSASCEAFVNQEFERMIYKHSWANGVKMMNLYMVSNLRASLCACMLSLCGIDVWRHELGQSRVS